jgi:hypothetical protein
LGLRFGNCIASYSIVPQLTAECLWVKGGTVNKGLQGNMQRTCVPVTSLLCLTYEAGMLQGHSVHRSVGASQESRPVLRDLGHAMFMHIVCFQNSPIIGPVRIKWLTWKEGRTLCDNEMMSLQPSNHTRYHGGDPCRLRAVAYQQITPSMYTSVYSCEHTCCTYNGSGKHAPL